MLDFSAMRSGERTLPEVANELSIDDLRQHTNDSIDMMLTSIEGCVDDDVVFEPEDPEANDAAAADEADANLAWNLGHVIAHATASGEEYAASGQTLARGAPYHGRPRYEVPWEDMKAIDQCRHRLEESRRLRLASLDMWPDEPHLDNLHEYSPRIGPMNAKAFFVLGLSHDDSHQDQVREIVRQAKASRGAS